MYYCWMLRKCKSVLLPTCRQVLKNAVNVAMMQPLLRFLYVADGVFLWYVICNIVSVFVLKERKVINL